MFQSGAAIFGQCDTMLRGLFAFGGCRPFPAYSRRTARQVAEVDEEVAALLEKFREEGHSPVDLIGSVSDVSMSLRQFRRAVGWDAGFRKALVGLVLGVIKQAERFGDGTGAFKRRFAIDLVIRVIEDSYAHNIPFPQLVRRTLQPFVGIFVDWSVAVLNIHNAWPARGPVELPKRFVERPYQLLGSFILKLWKVLVAVRRVFFGYTFYERQLSSARAAINIEAEQLQRVLPADRLIPLLEEALRLADHVGIVLLPHVAVIEAIVRLTATLSETDDESRLEVIVAVATAVLRDAYRDHPGARLLLESWVGRLILREIAIAIDDVLVRENIAVGRTQPALHETRWVA